MFPLFKRLLYGFVPPMSGFSDLIPEKTFSMEYQEDTVRDSDLQGECPLDGLNIRRE